MIQDNIMMCTTPKTKWCSRRLEALRKLGMGQILAIIREVSDRETQVIQLETGKPDQIKKEKLMKSIAEKMQEISDSL